MPKKDGQKCRILALLEILRRKTDENHALKASELVEILRAQDFDVERKTVYDDLTALEDAGFSIERSKGAGGGVKLLSRSFETAELKMLIDAVASAHFISEKKSRKIIDILCSFASDHQKSDLRRHIYMGNKLKSENQALIYSVDAINEAINSRRKITFFYTDRDLGKRKIRRKNGELYVVSPWELTIYDNNYYLIAYDSATDALRHYRVDKMENVRVSEEAQEGRERIKDLDLNDYCSPIFGMFSGEKEGVSISAPAHLVGVFIDRFGSAVRITPDVDRKSFSTHVEAVISPPFFGWLLSLGPGVKILSPEKTRLQYENALREALKGNQ